MTHRALLFLSVATLMTLLCLEAFANPGLAVGDEAVDFKLKSTSGAAVSLPEKGRARGVILVFISNHCPYSRNYEARLIALHNTYAPKGFPVIAINPGDEDYHAEESFEMMKVRAGEKKYPFEFLYDKSQTTALAYRPMHTPEVFLISYEGDKKVVRYRGSIDNSVIVQKVTERYLEDAIAGVLEKKPFLSWARSFGNTVRWKTK